MAKSGKGCALMLLVFVAGSIVLGLLNNREKTPNIPRPSLNPGAQCSVGLPGDQIGVSCDKTTYDRLTQLSLAEDHDGIRGMILEGQVLVVSGGTKAVVIDPGVFSTEIKILEGLHADRYGLVGTHNLHGK